MKPCELLSKSCIKSNVYGSHPILMQIRPGKAPPTQPACPVELAAGKPSRLQCESCMRKSQGNSASAALRNSMSACAAAMRGSLLPCVWSGNTSAWQLAIEEWGASSLQQHGLRF